MTLEDIERAAYEAGFRPVDVKISFRYTPDYMNTFVKFAELIRELVEKEKKE